MDARMKSVAAPWAAVKYNSIQKEKTEAHSSDKGATEAEDISSDN
jgi:hypothetical protein